MIFKIAQLVKTYYGIEGNVKSLVGYEDLNFLITTTGQEKYVLKLSKQPKALLEAQNEVFKQLKQHPTTCAFPVVIPTISQEELFLYSVNHESYWVRLLTFIEGTFLYEQGYSEAICYQLGQQLAQLHETVKPIQQELCFSSHQTAWDLQQALQIKPHIALIKEPEKRRLIHYFLLQFETEILPSYATLPFAILHNDAHDENILLSDNTIAGLIDFGDMTLAPRIQEIAIAITYALQGQENSLTFATEILKGYHAHTPLLKEEIQCLYYLIAIRACVSVTMSCYGRLQHPENTYISTSERGMWQLLETWIQLNPIHVTNRFYESCGYASSTPQPIKKVLKNRHAHISKSQSISYTSPIQMEKAALQYMYDLAGNTYLDGVNNIPHVGHCHPKIVEVAQKQWARLNTNTRYLYDQLTEYTAKLCDSFPPSLNKVFFVNSGSAASDLALRLARTHTKRKDVIVVDHAYHGNTTLGIELSPYKYEGKGGTGKMPYIHKAMIPDVYRGKYLASNPDAGILYAQEVEKFLSSAQPIAGFICESIIGCGGQIMLPKGYLKHVYNSVRSAGGVCIADEVQVGFGRVGAYFWGFELQDVVPDIVVLGKPMGNGHPMAAVVTTSEIAQSFENGMEFFSSFGGNSVSCAIGLAVLEVIEEEGLQENAKQVGSYLINELKNLQQRFPLMGDVRGAGLFLGIELVTNQETKTPAPNEAEKMVNDLKQSGILLSTDGPFHNVIKFKPPMIFSKSNADFLLTSLQKALAL